MASRILIITVNSSTPINIWAAHGPTADYELEDKHTFYKELAKGMEGKRTCNIIIGVVEYWVF